VLLWLRVVRQELPNGCLLVVDKVYPSLLSFVFSVLSVLFLCVAFVFEEEWQGNMNIKFVRFKKKK